MSQGSCNTFCSSIIGRLRSNGIRMTNVRSFGQPIANSCIRQAPQQQQLSQQMQLKTTTATVTMRLRLREHHNSNNQGAPSIAARLQCRNLTSSQSPTKEKCGLAGPQRIVENHHRHRLLPSILLIPTIRIQIRITFEFALRKQCGPRQSDDEWEPCTLAEKCSEACRSKMHARD